MILNKNKHYPNYYAIVDDYDMVLLHPCKKWILSNIIFFVDIIRSETALFKLKYDT